VTIGNHPTWNPFVGAVDEVQLYDVALSRKQVLQYYCAGCSGNQCCPLAQ